MTSGRMAPSRVPGEWLMLSTSPSPARSISHPVNLAKQGNRGTESSSGSSPAPPSKWGLLAMPAQHHLRGEPSPAAGTQDSPPTPSGKSGQYLTRNPSSSQADFQANGQLRERAAEPGRAWESPEQTAPSVPTHLPTREPRLSTHPRTLMLPSRPTHHPGVAWSRHCHVGSRPLGKSPPLFPSGSICHLAA